MTAAFETQPAVQHAGTVIWLCSGDVNASDIPAQLPVHVRLEVGRLDRQSLVAATASDALVVADLASSVTSTAEQISLLRQLSVRAICILRPEQVAALAQFINSGAARRILIHPVADDVLRLAILEGLAPAAMPEAVSSAVQSSIRAVADLLALAMPEAFGKGQRIARYACGLAHDISFGPTWPLMAASVLSQVGMVSLPPSLVTKIYQGLPLSEEERSALSLMPVIAEEITQGAPLLEGVRRLIRGAFGSEAGERVVPIDVQILRLAVAFESARETDVLCWENIDARLAEFEYWPPLAAALRRLAEREDVTNVIEVPLGDVKEGMILAEDVYDKSMLLLARGHRVQGRAAYRLRALGVGKGKARRVRVVAPGGA